MSARAALLAFILAAAAPASGRAAGPFLMPGLAELSVVPADADPADPSAPPQLALSYGLYLAGPFRGSVTVELRHDGEVVGREQQPRQLALVERQTARLGTGSVVEHRFGGARPDFLFRPTPGPYTLAVVLNRRATLEHRFQLAMVKTTSGSEPGIPAADSLGRASLRLSPPYYDEKCSPKDILWMTIPTDLRQERTRVDFLFYRGAALMGSFFRDVPVGPLRGEHARLKVPLHIGGWMDNLTREQVLAQDGPWEVHVIQDARYLTTCAFQVEAGHFGGAGAGSRELRCAPRRSQTAQEATGLAARVKGYKPAGLRALEVMAMHRSPQVREVRRRLLDPGTPAAEKARLAREFRRLIEQHGRGPGDDPS